MFLKITRIDGYIALKPSSDIKPQAVPALKQPSRAAPSQEWSITVSTVPTQEAIPEESG